MYLHYALPIYTASAIALRRLQQDWLPAAAPEHRVLGVFVPMVEVLAGVSWRNGAPVPHTSHPGRVAPDGMVAVFATQRTIHSGAYPFERSEEHTSELQSLMRISYAVFCLK